MSSSSSDFLKLAVTVVRVDRYFWVDRYFRVDRHFRVDRYFRVGRHFRVGRYFQRDRYIRGLMGSVHQQDTTLTVPFCTQENKWVPVNCSGKLTNCGE